MDDEMVWNEPTDIQEGGRLPPDKDFDEIWEDDWIDLGGEG